MLPIVRRIVRTVLLSTTIACLCAGTAFAQRTFTPRPVVTAPTGPTIPTRVPTPGINITIGRPDVPPAPTVPIAPTATTPARPELSTADPIYRDVPWPIPRPNYVENINLPQQRPLLSLHRPALLDAEQRESEIVVLAHIAEGPSIADDFDAELISSRPFKTLDADLVVIRVDKDQIKDEIIKLLLADERVLGAQPNYIFELQQDQTTPTPDPFMVELQYAPRQMSIKRAHQYSRGENVIIAVIDTGIDVTHKEFTNSNFTVFDAVDRPATASESHGTAIAGLIAANHSMIGIAPMAQIKSARAFAEEDGRFLSDSETIARAIDWAVSEGAQVINMSFAGPADPLILHMMDNFDRETMVVAAAGNNGLGAPAAYPAAHPFAFAITATDKNNALYTNANRGIYIDIAAPGVDVIAPSPNDGYDMTTGTSIATAHVTGIIALMLSKYPGLTDEDIFSVFVDTAADAGTPGRDPEFGLGLIDAYQAAFALVKEIGDLG